MFGREIRVPEFGGICLCSICIYVCVAHSYMFVWHIFMEISHICMTICDDACIFAREYTGQYMYKGNAGVCMHA